MGRWVVDRIKLRMTTIFVTIAATATPSDESAAPSAPMRQDPRWAGCLQEERRDVPTTIGARGRVHLTDPTKPMLDTGQVKLGDQDPEDYRQRLEAKLRPDRIRANLGFAGLYQMTHELIKTAVLHEVREFYWRGIESGVMVYDERAYAENVLAKAPKNKFRASLLWLIDGSAITLAQADRLVDIYAHRHDLSHELIKYMIDPDFEPDVELLIDALAILKAIRRFWTSVEMDIGSFDDFGDVDLDEVTPLSLAVLQICIDAYVAGLPTAE